MDITSRQLLQSSSGGKKSTYVEDLFNTKVWQGNGTAGRSIDVGIDMAGEGGMSWIKRTNNTESYCLNDTVRGGGKYLQSNGTAGEATDTNRFTSFTSTGFTLGNDTMTNAINNSYVGWSFRKSEGFFDVVTYTGNDTGGTQIAHNLGSVPGCVMIKRYDGNEDWAVWHRAAADLAAGNTMTLNQANPVEDNNIYFWDTAPTATHFTVGTSNRVNVNGNTYVAYIFAGGESTAATARSVELDGSDDYFTITNSSDFNFGTGDFTIEWWQKCDTLTGGRGPWTLGAYNSPGGAQAWIGSDGKMKYYDNRSGGMVIDSKRTPQLGQWQHYAITKASGTTRMFVDGIFAGSTTASNGNALGDNGQDSFIIGVERNSSNNIAGYFDGRLSNMRIVKGTAVYTSSFKVPTEPLTNISGTVLLCFNNPSTTGATVTPATIVANSAPSAKIDSPFDDIAAYKFGEDEDQNIIKCGGYTGQSTADLEAVLGWEPQWLLVRIIDAGDNWYLSDNIRGMATITQRLNADTTNAQQARGDDFKPTAAGFTVGVNNDTQINLTDKKYSYIAIRRPDAYVGKPAKAGTDVFNMVMGTSNSDVPTFVSGFVTDFAFSRQPAGSENWWTQSRITATGYVVTNLNQAESTSASNEWDFMNGWYSSTSDHSNQQSWMWKRHAGFDVAAYKGNATSGLAIPHSLGRVPEMIWIKSRGSTDNWAAGHKGLNGGTNPWQYAIQLNGTAGEDQTSSRWNNTAPTSRDFSVGNAGPVNDNNALYIAYLFASVAGISKCGYYTGSGSSAKVISDVGFTPRFLIIKCATDSWGWSVFDSTRGLTSGGNDPVLYLNNTNAQSSSENYITDVSATGFTVAANYNLLNQNNEKYIYYAHA